MSKEILMWVAVLILAVGNVANYYAGYRAGEREADRAPTPEMWLALQVHMFDRRFEEAIKEVRNGKDV